MPPLTILMSFRINCFRYRQGLLTLLLTLFLSLLWSPASAAIYAYDELGRVISITYDDGSQVIYVFDAAGNRTEERRTITTANRAPIPANDAVSISEDTLSVTFDPRTNDVDPESQLLTVYSVSSGVFGAATLAPNGASITYAPMATRTATETIVYVVRDNLGASASGLVTIALANLAPTAIADLAQTLRDQAVTILPLVNDSDPGFDPLTISDITAPTHGTATITGGGQSVLYVPAQNYVGNDLLSYTVTDVDGGSASNAITISVTAPANRPPVAVNDTLTAIVGIAAILDPRVNDTDPDGGVFMITQVGTPSHGAASIVGSGTSVSYTAISGYSGLDSFSYTIADSSGATASATINVTVSSANTPPIAVDDLLEIEVMWQGAFTPIGQADVVLNDTDANGHTLQILSTGNGANGNVTWSGNVVTYTYNTVIAMPGTLPLDSFTYTVSDGHGGTDIGTVNVTVVIYPPE